MRRMLGAGLALSSEHDALVFTKRGGGGEHLQLVAPLLQQELGLLLSLLLPLREWPVAMGHSAPPWGPLMGPPQSRGCPPLPSAPVIAPAASAGALSTKYEIAKLSTEKVKKGQSD